MTEEYVTVEEARKILDVSKAKMATWIRDGVLHAEENVFNKRQKLIKRSEVEALKQRPGFSRMAKEESSESQVWAGLS